MRPAFASSPSTVPSDRLLLLGSFVSEAVSIRRADLLRGLEEDVGVGATCLAGAPISGDADAEEGSRGVVSQGWVAGCSRLVLETVAVRSCCSANCCKGENQRFRLGL
jgi:hypothetical protein